MTAPAVATTAESASTTATTTHTVTYPASIAAGDLLVLLCSGTTASANQFNPTGAGFTESLNGAGPGQMCYGVFWKKAAGTESGTFSVTSANSFRAAFIVYRITGAADPTVTTPLINSPYTSSTTSLLIGPYSPSAGTKDYLGLAILVQEGEEADDDTWVNTVDNSYRNLLQKTTGTAGSA